MASLISDASRSFVCSGCASARTTTSGPAPTRACSSRTAATTLARHATVTLSRWKRPDPYGTLHLDSQGRQPLETGSHGRYSFVAKRPNSYGTRHLDSQVRQPLELGQVRQQAAAKLQVAAASGSRRAPPPPGAVLSWSSPNRCRARPLRRVRASRRGRRGTGQRGTSFVTPPRERRCAGVIAKRAEGTDCRDGASSFSNPRGVGDGRPRLVPPPLR